MPDAIWHHCDRIVPRPVKLLTKDLSPSRVLADLFDLGQVGSVDRHEAATLADIELPVRITLIAHHWPADIFRIFGASYFAQLLRPGTGSVTVDGHRTLAFRQGKSFAGYEPVLEYASEGALLFPVRVRTFDTREAFGKGSLDVLARTFLGFAKSDALSIHEKAQMLETFRRKTAQCYGYAMVDGLITLLLEEGMRQADADIYGSLGFADIPRMRGTVGGRIRELLVSCVARGPTVGSVALSQRGKPLPDGEVGLVAKSKVKRLMSQGSRAVLSGPRISMFGQQTSETHGGLLFNRSPTKVFHEAPGEFRDVDLTGCYGAIIGSGGMSLYAGMPVIYEPGARKMKLKAAVAYLAEHAAGWDAWIVKVSGPITRMPNVLIPSTCDALTNANFKSRAARKRACYRQTSVKDNTGSVIYTDVIESGIVAWPTWLMIQALPAHAQRDYENLEVESIIFYPRDLVVDSGADYDRLVEQLEGDTHSPPWRSDLDLPGRTRTTREDLGVECAALRYDLGELARQLTKQRQEARRQHGQGSGAELAAKLLINNLYGVLASRHTDIGNVVAANVITATARALAFSMQLPLNGYQVITDGCTYRCDQVPDATLAECLRADPEYPIRRLEEGVQFVAPRLIREDGNAFTRWYRRHVKRFFGVEGDDYDWLFSLHSLEHKTCGTPARIAFDGLCCDGSANYIKLVIADDAWRIADIKARSHRGEAKEQLGQWILGTYSNDRYEPPPIIESRGLLKLDQARIVARKALEWLAEQGVEEPLVWFPLGLEIISVLTYKIIKPSTFLFRTPQQRKKMVKAMDKFSQQRGIGLETLALRRSHGRHQGSITDIAEAIYQAIRAGKDNLSKTLNLTRSLDGFEDLDSYCRELEDCKQGAREELYRTIDARNLDAEALLTGYLVGPGDRILDTPIG